MTIQLTLPNEYVEAAKPMIRMVDPSKVDPTDEDVAAYVGTALLNGVRGLFPGVVLASQAEAVAAVAAAQAAIDEATAAAMAIQVVV